MSKLPMFRSLMILKRSLLRSSSYRRYSSGLYNVFSNRPSKVNEYKCIECDEMFDIENYKKMKNDNIDYYIEKTKCLNNNKFTRVILPILYTHKIVTNLMIIPGTLVGCSAALFMGLMWLPFSFFKNVHDGCILCIPMCIKISTNFYPLILYNIFC